MNNRTPSIADLAQLDRDEWENFCSLICVLNYSAHRIEDHLGKGNGLDAFRETDKGIEGWQIRRFNDRLGLKQENRIKENITLAHEKSISELDQPLVMFTIIFNIDPEPGHKGKIGEIERLNKIKQWAKTKYNVKFEYKGISWVLLMLLNNPTLKPELFEDINKSLKDVSNSLHGEIFDLKSQITSLIEVNTLTGKVKNMFNILLNEANVHYKRGLDFESEEEFRKSILSLNDALRLIEDQDIDITLEGKTLSLLAGLEGTIGYLERAIQHSKKAINLLKSDTENDFYIFAQGNLALSLYMNQEYQQPKIILNNILNHFENKGNLLEIVRTLTHLLQIEIFTKNFKSAFELADRIRTSSDALGKILGPSDVTISSLGTVANLYTEIGIQRQDKRFLREAVDLFTKVEAITNCTSLKRINVTTKAARARCLWNLDKIEEAIDLFKEVIIEAKDFLPKISTDAKYNLALLMRELKQPDKVRQYLSEAIEEYKKMGDYPSAEDAQGLLL
ncbi:hypothetical protein A9Q81_28165 [Gammaproteobacteria bacterium 42_54_T18]|nr:hypothetical protein A9Q81_28165 [Gammaproteobacteria bacterium 42_54_T18]